MRRLICVVALCVLAASFAAAQSWSAPADFRSFFWTEMFKGGGVGQPGNVLHAEGQEFTFNKATLLGVEVCPAYASVVGLPVATSCPAWAMFKTTYMGGELTLNPSGPWGKLKKGTLKAKNLTAYNYSNGGNPPGSKLTFQLEIGPAPLDNAPGMTFSLTATYDGIPEVKLDDYGNPLFQRGSEFGCTITITK